MYKNIENSLLKSEPSDIGDTKVKLNNASIKPLKMNY